MKPTDECKRPASLEKLELLRQDGEVVLWRGRGGPSGSALVLVPAAEEASAQLLARFAHEYGLRDKLDPAWAVRPVALVERAGTAELMLEDPGGLLLEAVLRDHAHSADGGLDLETFFTLGLRMAEALDRLHEHGIIHKDIRPANVMISPDWASVRYTGFGVASLLPRHRPAPEPVESMEGTIAYMAPEQTGRMNRSVDSRSDLYSLGVTLFEMLTGQLPFESDDPIELVHFHVARRPLSPSRLRADLPQPVSAIVMKLLAKPAEERYQTAAGLAADLRHCLDAWRRDRAVPDFRLGANDAPNRLAIPEKLYGRDEEMGRLLAATERVTKTGTLEIVLVAGYSGVGKSALVGELHKALIEPRAIFAAGKFDQFKRHIPYATLAQAFQGAVRQVLGQSEQQLEGWRRAILDAVGANGRLITELIPELVLLIGEQPPVPDLPPSDSQHRFFATFRRFLCAWATVEHPLVLLLDDLQWVDPGSLKLLEHLTASSEVRNLLLIGAYRDNEVGPSHPLALAIEAIRARTRVEEILLLPLSPDHLGQMVAEALACAPDDVQPLVELIGRKTGGNPFFAIQFMQGLFQDDLLRPSPDGWQWDIGRIAAKDFTDNVVDLMVSKLLRLPEATQKVMRQLACLGNIVSIPHLRMVHDAPAEALDGDLEEALRASYLIRRNDVIRFSHDRIQEAAYALLPPEERPAEHLRIGRKLAASLDPADVEDQIFEVVNHFNLGCDLLSDVDERRQLCRWNARAGAKAKTSAAYATAQAYFAQAMELLPPDAWDEDYDETLSLVLERSACELLLGNFQIVDDLFPVILDHARGNADRARAYRQRILRNQVAGRYGDGVEVALEALRMVGIACPASQEEIDAAVLQARQDAVANLGEREIGDLIDAPAMTDRDALGMLGVLADAMPCSFLARPDLYAWLVLQGLNVTLRHGNTGDSCSVYMGYAIVLVSIYNEIDASLQYADLALKLQEKLQRPDLKGRILVRNGVFINSRRNPIASSIDILREGFIECHAAGDYSYAAYGALEISWLTLESGGVLDDVAGTALKYAAFAEQSRNNGLLHTLNAEAAFVTCLTGKTGVEEFVAGGADTLAALSAAKFGTGTAYFHLMNQLVALLHGDHEQASRHSGQVTACLKSITGWVAETTYHFLAVLTWAALAGRDGAADRAAVAGHMDLLASRAADSPENYGCRHLLAAAELARVDGDVLAAERLYEDAIQSARDNGVRHIEAMALELASRFYRGRGRALIADAYLWKAREGYARWGAAAKVKRIEAEHPELAERVHRSGGTEPLHNLDMISVVKASQAVSGEIALDRLIETLLRIAVENAGADRGALVVDLGGTPTVVADAHIGDGAVIVETLRQEPGRGNLPAKILNYVRRAMTRVLLDDASVATDFEGDEYLKRSRTKSVLCLPLVKQSKLIGLLYLENSQISHVFTADRVAVLDVLASQAAISLENSLLYEDLERHRDALEEMVAQRTAELIEKKNQLDRTLAEQDIILDNASLGIVVTAPGQVGRRLIRRANHAAERLFGYEPGGLVGVETQVLLPNEEDFKALSQAYGILARGGTYSGEHAIRRWNGTIGYGRLVGAAIDPSDLSKGAIWLCEDITDRRAAEAALKAAKEVAEELASAFRLKSEQVANLLDNSGQGFLSFGADLVVDPEYSRACESMLGEAPAGKDVTALLFPSDPPKAELLRLGVSMALEERDRDRQTLFISLLPAEAVLGRLILKVEYRVLDGGHIMVVLTDITEERRLQEKVHSEHRLLQMVVAAVTDSHDFFDSITAFSTFIDHDMPRLLGAPISAAELLEELYREIHTFKGTLNQFSFQHTPDALHVLEGRLGEMRTHEGGLTVAEIKACVATMPLKDLFEKDLAGLREIIGDEFLEKGKCVTISAEQAVQLEKLASSLLRGQPIDTTAAEMRRLLLEIGYLQKTPLRDVLSGYGRTVGQIAARLEKELAPIVIEGGDDIWINPNTFGPFMRSLVHVFRNAVAHGIEDPETRLKTGKDEYGHITCSVRAVGERIELTIADDGAGIDLEGLRAKAVKTGIINGDVMLSEREVLELVFRDNMSTNARADQFSGRGVGLAAVRAEVQKLGGTVSVRSTPGRGAAFTFSLPYEGSEHLVHQFAEIED